MKFIDEARIEVKAGHGGPGMCHFRREKFIPLGGPDGGDGGHGGSVIITADPGRHTLLDLHMRPLWRAKDGKGGGTNNREGKSAADLVIPVPPGTQVFRHEDRSLLFDLSRPGETHILARGGRGGKGNTHFKSSTNRAPQHFQPGEDGEQGVFHLVLKLVADVGLIGLPNAGKSTLISSISAARPKIADYPFTTLVPNLGVVRAGDTSFVIADIPGLIPGAHEGRGLGIKFLKHVERTRILAHLVDCSQVLEDASEGDPLRSFRMINNELTEYAPELGMKSQILVITKLDLIQDREPLNEALSAFRDSGIQPFIISSVSGEGLKSLVHELGARLNSAVASPEA